MMNCLRKILFPFSIIYGCITGIRNNLYKSNFFKRHTFSIPLIVVGNLSVGGTGKTPMIEYLIRLLESKYKLAVLSRGYKRKSKGFILSTDKTQVEEIGDEPFQFHQKFKNISVAVDADRVNGITQLQKQIPDLDLVLLDDAYQHLRVLAGMNILLTTYSDLYSKDLILPAGNLRESKKGAERAQIVVVTKCPKDISESEQNAIRENLKLNQEQNLFFTYIEFADEIISKLNKLTVDTVDFSDVILVAGIANPKLFFNKLKADNTICISYPDHHFFSESDLESILKKANGKKIITTEKDYMRLQEVLPEDQLYYLPIRTSFINRVEEFNKIILNYVEQNSRNSSVFKR